MSTALAKKLLLVGWDAADWQMIHPLLDAGRMPNLQRVVEEGVSGNILALPPANPLPHPLDEHRHRQAQGQPGSSVSSSPRPTE